MNIGSKFRYLDRISNKRSIRLKPGYEPSQPNLAETSEYQPQSARQIQKQDPQSRNILHQDHEEASGSN